MGTSVAAALAGLLAEVSFCALFIGDAAMTAFTAVLVWFLVGIGYVAVAFADVAWLYLAAALVWTFGQMLAAPANASINAELSPVEMRGRYQAIFNLVFPAASFVAPAIGGLEP